MSPPLKLSENFWLREFTRSTIAARRGIDNTPPADALLNLDRLANEVLEAVRRDVCAFAERDVALYITSGYRCSELNALVGGSAKSDHMLGRAADVVAIGVPIGDFAAIAKRSCEQLPVRQCIFEFGEWVHLSIEPYGRTPTREYLLATRDADRTVYARWS